MSALKISGVGVSDSWFVNGKGTAFVGVAPGSDLDYVVEVTPDDTRAPGYNPAAGNWFTAFNPAVGGAGTVSVSEVFDLPTCAAARLRVARWTAGSVSLQIARPGGTYQ